mmetsp:Transcript_16115/g.52495  ORF Transcript_16115/g.52495 Transcript_16115/m.52495 type:complete len:538 (+) Transcript_16115:52-1665(+)
MFSFIFSTHGEDRANPPVQAVPDTPERFVDDEAGRSKAVKDGATVGVSSHGHGRPVVGVLCVDHPDCGDIAVLEGAAGYVVAYANARIAPMLLHAARSEIEQTGAVSAGLHARLRKLLRVTVNKLREEHGAALIGVACDSLFVLCCPGALVEACGGIPLLPSALLQAPLAMAQLQPHETLLALVDMTATLPFPDGQLGAAAAQMTAELLDRGVCLPTHLHNRILVESISGCAALAAASRDASCDGGGTAGEAAAGGAGGDGPALGEDGGGGGGVACAIGEPSPVMLSSLIAHVSCILASHALTSPIGALLLESPHLLPYADAMRRATGKPVFDVLSLAAGYELAVNTGATRHGGGASHLEGAPSAHASLPTAGVSEGAVQRRRVVVGAGDVRVVALAIDEPTLLEFGVVTESGRAMVWSVAQMGAKLASGVASEGSTRVRLELVPGEASLNLDNSASWIRASTATYALRCTPLASAQARPQPSPLEEARRAAAQHRWWQNRLSARAQAAGAAAALAARECCRLQEGADAADEATTGA